MSLFRILALCATALAAGCQYTQKAPVTYTAQTQEQLSGSVAVAPFDYSAAKAAKIPVNQIPYADTSFPNAELPQPVQGFVADSLRKELAKAGVSTNGRTCALSGDVTHFQFDYRDVLAKFTVEIRYRLADAANQPLYESTKLAQSADTAELREQKRRHTLGNLGKALAGSLAVKPYDVRGMETSMGPQPTPPYPFPQGFARILSENIEQLLKDNVFRKAVARCA
ncbi:MAG TPA: hypothetical protein VD995_11975 [Azospirillum sp.]|nr:hypothetical protein [Azospirillum sp.]